MILLDTDHLSTLTDARRTGHGVLVARMSASADQGFAAPIVAVEEQIRGWMASISRERDFAAQVAPYRKLGRLLAALRNLHIEEFTDAAAELADRWRRDGVRIGSMDLKIAATAEAAGATLLSANAVDFRRVPGLKVEDWIH